MLKACGSFQYPLLTFFNLLKNYQLKKNQLQADNQQKAAIKLKWGETLEAILIKTHPGILSGTHMARGGPSHESTCSTRCRGINTPSLTGENDAPANEFTRINKNASPDLTKNIRCMEQTGRAGDRCVERARKGSSKYKNESNSQDLCVEKCNIYI